MRKNISCIAGALLLAGFSACNHQPEFKVEGTVADAADKMLYLEQAGLEGIVALDSARLDEEGVFSFAAARPESPEFYRLRIEDKVINFSVDSVETVKVTAQLPDFATGYQVEGSENSAKIKELVLLQTELQNRVNGLSGMPAGIAQDSCSISILEKKKLNIDNIHLTSL